MWRLGIIGFGNVGQGFIRLLASKKDFLGRKYDFRFSIIAIADPVKGNAYSQDGLDINELIRMLDISGDIQSFSGYKDFSSLDVASEFDLDIVVEATPTNIKDGEPGLTHIRTALESGRHVVTSNKGPIALAYRELMDIARRKNVYLRFEGTVMSGTPVLELALDSLAGCEIYGVRGILNGTTNYVLTRMEYGLSYEEAIREAQALGYAEADPSMDVEGWDAAIKTVILANTLMDANISIHDVDREGILGINSEDVMEAVKHGKRIKLLACVERRTGGVVASVKPMELDINDPLASVMGATNAVAFDTDNLGMVTLIGPGAGRIETGQALLKDILYIHKASFRYHNP